MLYGIVEFLGWFGAVTVLAGYILFSTGKLPNGPVYQLFNLVGGLAVAVNVAAHHAIPSTIVNGIWAIVAVVVLAKMAKARRAAKRGVPMDSEQPALLTEPPATTAVLPIVGPALRDHEQDATDPADATPGLQAQPTTATTEAITATTEATTATTEATTEATTVAAPMTESIPVITATIALALVAAAQDHAERQDQAARAEQDADRADAADHTLADHVDHAHTPADEPQRADATHA